MQAYTATGKVPGLMKGRANMLRTVYLFKAQQTLLWLDTLHSSEAASLPGMSFTCSRQMHCTA
jgi:hypothetical protein